MIRTRNWAQALPEDQRPVFSQVDSLAQAVREVKAVWKFALTDDDIPRLQRFAQEVGETLGLACEWSWHDQVDIARAGNSKGKRLAQWVADQGLSMQNVVAFGDNYNDLSMLEAAGTGVAMGNAVDEVKARATWSSGTMSPPASPSLSTVSCCDQAAIDTLLIWANTCWPGAIARSSRAHGLIRAHRGWPLTLS